MDFWRTVLVLVRRWYITVPAFFAALAFAAAAYFAMPTQYQSGSVLVVTTPLSGGTVAAHANTSGSLTNPMLNFDRSVSLTASIVIQEMSSPEIAGVLGITPGGAISYQVTNGSSNPELLESGPFLFVQGNGPSPEAALGVTERAAAMAAQILADRQARLDAPASTHMSLQEVVPATASQPLNGSPLRAAAAVGALASLAGLAAAFAFENLMAHRMRRRAVSLAEADPLPTAAGAVSIGALNRRSSDLDPPADPRSANPSEAAIGEGRSHTLAHGYAGVAAGVLESLTVCEVDDDLGHAADKGRQRQDTALSADPAEHER